MVDITHSEYYKYLFKNNGVPPPFMSNRSNENVYYVSLSAIIFNWKRWEDDLICDHHGKNNNEIDKIKITSTCPNIKMIGEYYSNMIHLQCRHGQWHKYSIIHYDKSTTSIIISFNSRSVIELGYKLMIY